MGAASETPLWRQAFDRAERLIGGPLEELVQTRRFADVIVLSFRVQGVLWGTFERNTRAVLHLWNMPTRTDLERLNRQVAALRGELRELASRLEEGARQP